MHEPACMLLLLLLLRACAAAFVITRITDGRKTAKFPPWCHPIVHPTNAPYL
jgi:hypothetical protein